MTPEVPRRFIKVAAAALIQDGKVLIVRRPPGDVGAGGWEFPGGKIEEGETPEQAVVREIDEELALAVRVVASLGNAVHAYENLDLDLFVFVCERTAGTLELREHDAQEWLTADELAAGRLLPADRPFVEPLRAWMRANAKR